jgi:hypothetical protein
LEYLFTKSAVAYFALSKTFVKIKQHPDELHIKMTCSTQNVGWQVVSKKKRSYQHATPVQASGSKDLTDGQSLPEKLNSTSLTG